jgi:hypothetical protein
MEKVFPGIYQFSLPYLIDQRLIDSNGYHLVRTVDVEIHVGRKEDLGDGKLATVIALSTVGFSNYVEEIFTKIRRLFFHEIFQTKTGTELFLSDDRIRLIEVHAKTQDIYDWQEVQMEWDFKRECYCHPVWKTVSPDTWYYQEYQKKIRSFARQGLQYFHGIDLSSFSSEWDQTILSLLQLGTQTPLWLSKAIHQAQTYLLEHQLPTHPLLAVINSLKKLAGAEINTLSYVPEVTAILIEEIHKCRQPQCVSSDLDRYVPSQQLRVRNSL